MDDKSFNRQSNEYYALDVFKLIFALSVVAIHIDPMVSQEGNYIYKVYQSFIYLAVPFFFLTTGFLMGESLYTINDNINEKDFLINKIKKYAWLYLTWTIVYAPLAIWHYIYSNMKSFEIIKDLVKGFFWIGENYNSYILWYLLSSLYSLIFIYFFRKMKITYNHILIISVLVALVAILLVDYKNGVFKLSGFVGMIFLKFSNVGARVVTGFFYITMGIVIGIKRMYMKKYLLYIFIATGILLEIISQGYGFVYEIGRALATIGIVYTLVGIQLKPSNIYLTFRKLSSSLYYWHMWVYTLLSFVIYGMGNMHKGVIMYLDVVLIIGLMFTIIHYFQKRIEVHEIV